MVTVRPVVIFFAVVVLERTHTRRLTLNGPHRRFLQLYDCVRGLPLIHCAYLDLLFLRRLALLFAATQDEADASDHRERNYGRQFDI